MEVFFLLINLELRNSSLRHPREDEDPFFVISTDLDTYLRRYEDTDT